jgi:hypothetical protein
MKGLMGMDVTTEATEVSTAPIAASTWTIPTDYAQKEGDKDTKGKR